MAALRAMPPEEGGPPRSSRGGGRLSLWQRFMQWWRTTLTGNGGSEFLCDTCKYDYGRACTRPERPNARRCPDYKRR